MRLLQIFQIILCASVALAHLVKRDGRAEEDIAQPDTLGRIDSDRSAPDSVSHRAHLRRSPGGPSATETVINLLGPTDPMVKSLIIEFHGKLKRKRVIILASPDADGYVKVFVAFGAIFRANRLDKILDQPDGSAKAGELLMFMLVGNLKDSFPGWHLPNGFKCFFHERSRQGNTVSAVTGSQWKFKPNPNFMPSNYKELTDQEKQKGGREIYMREVAAWLRENECIVEARTVQDAFIGDNKDEVIRQWEGAAPPGATLESESEEGE